MTAAVATRRTGNFKILTDTLPSGRQVFDVACAMARDHARSVLSFGWLVTATAIHGIGAAAVKAAAGRRIGGIVDLADRPCFRSWAGQARDCRDQRPRIRMNRPADDGICRAELDDL